MCLLWVLKLYRSVSEGECTELYTNVLSSFFLLKFAFLPLTYNHFHSTITNSFPPTSVSALPIPNGRSPQLPSFLHEHYLSPFRQRNRNRNLSFDPPFLLQTNTLSSFCSSAQGVPLPPLLTTNLTKPLRTHPCLPSCEMKCVLFVPCAQSTLTHPLS